MLHAAAVEVPCTINEIGTYHVFCLRFLTFVLPFDENKKKKDKEKEDSNRFCLIPRKEGEILGERINHDLSGISQILLLPIIHFK